MKESILNGKSILAVDDKPDVLDIIEDPLPKYITSGNPNRQNSTFLD